MLNEFVYCPRLFYYEFVEGIFVQNADTLKGKNLHSRVDNDTRAMPEPKTKNPAPTSSEESQAMIDSRSVHLSSERLAQVSYVASAKGLKP